MDYLLRVAPIDPGVIESVLCWSSPIAPVAQRYEDPPIQEAICEFRFGAESDWDSTYPGLIYTELKDDFPKKRTATAHGLGIGNEDEPPRVETEERTRFFREDENALIQVGPQYLSANRLAPYESWKEFREVINTGYKSYLQVADPVEIERVSLRYINRVEIEADEITLDDYFNLGLQTGEGLPESYFSFIAGFVSEFADGRDALRVQMTSAETNQEETVGVLLELQYTLTQPQAIEVENVASWLDDAHDEIENGFEASIKDSLRMQFGQIEESSS